MNSGSKKNIEDLIWNQLESLIVEKDKKIDVNINKKNKKKYFDDSCLQCFSYNIIFFENSSEMICGDCGIIQEIVINDSFNIFSGCGNDNEKNNLTSNEYIQIYDIWNLDHDSKIKYKIENIINNVCCILDYPDLIKCTAINIFMKQYTSKDFIQNKRNIHRGKVLKGIIGGCIYVSCKNEFYSCDIKKLSNILNIEQKYIKKGVDKINQIK
jgi:transcription initiation factor TFIIIB Brf1 subunit/transcription initiation factor TFIIB